MIFLAQLLFLTAQHVHCWTVIGYYPVSFVSPPSGQPRAAEVYDVVIIGAGTAGLAAAGHLHKTHHIENFTILEAQDRIGGRVFTKYDVGENGEFLEVGAEFIHGEVRNSIFQYAKKQGLIAPDQTPRNVGWYNMNGQRISASEVDEMDRVYRRLRREVEFSRDVTTSVGDGIKERFEKWIDNNMQNAPLKRALFYYFYLDECLMASDDLLNLSIDQDLNFVDASGYQQHVAENGLQSVLQHFVADLPFNSTRLLQLNSCVKTINWEFDCWDGKRVAVELTDGRIVLAKYAIVTLPLGVLKAQTVSFDPPLPQAKQEAISRLGYGCINKVFLVFERPWWKTNQQVNALFVDNIPDGIDVTRRYYSVANETWYKNLVAFGAVYGNPLALEAWLSGEPALVMERLPVDEVSHVLSQILKRAFSKDFDVERPTYVMKTSWCYNPFSLGGVSYIAMDSRQLDFDVLAEPLPKSGGRLFFAGEATSSTQWGSVHGAWDTGKVAADMIGSALLYQKFK